MELASYNHAVYGCPIPEDITRQTSAMPYKDLNFA